MAPEWGYRHPNGPRMVLQTSKWPLNDVVDIQMAPEWCCRHLSGSWLNQKCPPLLLQKIIAVYVHRCCEAFGQFLDFDTCPRLIPSVVLPHSCFSKLVLYWMPNSNIDTRWMLGANALVTIPYSSIRQRTGLGRCSHCDYVSSFIIL